MASNDPPPMPTPECQRCGRRSLLGYLRFLDPDVGQKQDLHISKGHTITYWGREDLASYGGEAVYLGRYENLRRRGGLASGSYDVVACGTCWQAILDKLEA